MHRVGTIGSTANTSRPRKERRLTYVLANSNNSKHCSGINCLAVPQCESEAHNTDGVLFSGSRDGTLKRWDLSADAAVCSATFESHADWVNDVVLIAGETLVSCSSDTTIKTWRAFSEGACTRTFRQHSDYVTSLAAAKQNSVVASGGLGGEVFLWDLEAATVPISKAANDKPEEIGLGGNTVSGGPCQVILNDRVNLADQTFSTASGSPSEVYSPLSLKGHKESVYALAMNEPGTLLVSGGTEKAIRVWDTRTGAKQMKLKGHTDNIRALVLDPSGRLCLSGSSDSMIRLWDIGQQRCIHSYAVHTDSVWSLASTPSFNHVYSGGRDLSVYLTDLASRESTLICVEQHPVLKIALHGGEWFWLATSDSSIHKWRTKEHTSVKNLQRASSFVAGTLPFARARACLEGSPLVPLNAEPAYIIPGTAGIVKHAILNNRQHVLTKDAVGVVKLWEITRGAVIKDYGKVSFEEKEKELFEMVSVPTWFTMDTRLGSISVHLDTPQCFSAEMYAMDLHVPDSSEDQKVNLGQETLRGLFAHWFNRRQHRTGMQPATNGDAVLGQGVFNNHVGSERRNTGALAAFQFSTTSPPSIITEGSKGGPWRKKITDLDSSDDEKCFPSWCMEYLLHNRCPAKEHTKCSFYLHAYEGTPLQVVTQGKLSAPRILRVQKVINYVLEKMILEKPLEATAPESGNSSSGHVIKQQQQQQPQPQPQPQLQLQQQHQLASNPTGARCIKAWQQKTKCDVEILCNNQVLAPDMSLATVRTYIWKKPEDLYLQYRLVMNP